MKEENNISKKNLEKVKESIEKQYGTLSNLAVKMNITSQNLSNKLQRMAPKFVEELKGYGVNINEILKEEEQGSFQQGNIKKSIAGKFSNVEGGISYGGVDNPYIQVLNEMIEMLKSDKKKLEERVAELEKEIKELRANR